MRSMRCLLVLVFVSIWKYGCSADVDILKELKLINDRLKDMMVENASLKEKTGKLERVTSSILNKNALLEKRTSELETLTRDMSNENVQLRKRISLFESSAKIFEIEIIDIRKMFNNLKINLIKMDKNFTGFSTDETKVTNADAKNLHEGDNSKKIKWNIELTAPVTTENPFPSNKNRRLLLPSVTVTAGNFVSAPIMSDRHVSFFAIIKQSIANVGDNQEIPFETVITDTNQAFHAGTGLFTCPQTGVYAFTATILTLPTKWGQFQIVKEGTWFARGYSYGDAVRYGTGTTFGIVRLQKGDKVWVRIDGASHTTGMGNVILTEWSSFSGFSLSLDP